jgi:hypothetical protein
LPIAHNLQKKRQPSQNLIVAKRHKTYQQTLGSDADDDDNSDDDSNSYGGNDDDGGSMLGDGADSEDDDDRGNDAPIFTFPESIKANPEPSEWKLYYIKHKLFFNKHVFQFYTDNCQYKKVQWKGLMKVEPFRTAFASSIRQETYQKEIVKYVQTVLKELPRLLDYGKGRWEIAKVYKQLCQNYDNTYN